MASFMAGTCIPLCLVAVLANIETAAWAGNAKASSDAFFEGKYLVGKTACTVTPIKMAFQVQCGKRKPAELFFFDGQKEGGGPSYSATHGKPRKPRFVFEDDAIKRGTFIDRQGKQYRVIRKSD